MVQVWVDMPYLSRDGSHNFSLIIIIYHIFSEFSFLGLRAWWLCFSGKVIMWVKVTKSVIFSKSFSFPTLYYCSQITPIIQSTPVKPKQDMKQKTFLWKNIKILGVELILMEQVGSHTKCIACVFCLLDIPSGVSLEGEALSHLFRYGAYIGVTQRFSQLFLENKMRTQRFPL